MGTSRSSLDSADMKFLFALSLLSSVLAQDTYHCPDGWVLEEDRSGCRCFYFEGTERVTRDDADLLCQSHDAWVAELDHPGINYWLKSQLLNRFEAGDRIEFWMGAFTGERHSENAPGEWIWPHKNETVQWFDWAEGQPNNYHGQYCMALMEWHRDPFYFDRDYFWNDLECDWTQHYICEKQCAQY